MYEPEANVSRNKGHNTKTKSYQWACQDQLKIRQLGGNPHWADKVDLSHQFSRLHWCPNELDRLVQMNFEVCESSEKSG